VKDGGNKKRSSLNQRLVMKKAIMKDANLEE
jgi:hypothetical protein